MRFKVVSSITLGCTTGKTQKNNAATTRSSLDMPRATAASCSSTPSSIGTASTAWHPAAAATTFIQLSSATAAVPGGGRGPIPSSPSPSPPPPPPSSQAAPTTPPGRAQIAIGLVGIFAVVVAIAVAFWVYRHRTMSKDFRKFRRTYSRHDPNTVLRVVSHGLLEYCTPPTRRRSALKVPAGGGDDGGGYGDSDNGDSGPAISRLPKRLSRRIQMRKSGGGWAELGAGIEETDGGWGANRNREGDCEEEREEGEHDISRSIHTVVGSGVIPPEPEAGEGDPLGDSEELQLWKIWTNKQSDVEESP